MSRSQSGKDWTRKSWKRLWTRTGRICQNWWGRKRVENAINLRKADELRKCCKYDQFEFARIVASCSQIPKISSLSAKDQTRGLQMDQRPMGHTWRPKHGAMWEKQREKHTTNTILGPLSDQTPNHSSKIVELSPKMSLQNISQNRRVSDKSHTSWAISPKLRLRAYSHSSTPILGVIRN